MTEPARVISPTCPPDVEGYEWDCQCARCGSSVGRNICPECGGDGYAYQGSDEDHQDEPCRTCNGYGGQWVCMSEAAFCLANPLPGKAHIERGQIEWYPIKEDSAELAAQEHAVRDTSDWHIGQCPTCNGAVEWRWTGLRAVAQTGDENAASKEYHPIDEERERLEAAIKMLAEELKWYGHCIAGGGPIVGYANEARRAEARWYEETMELLRNLPTGDALESPLDKEADRDRE